LGLVAKIFKDGELKAIVDRQKSKIFLPSEDRKYSPANLTRNCWPSLGAFLEKFFLFQLIFVVFFLCMLCQISLETIELSFLIKKFDFAG